MPANDSDSESILVLTRPIATRYTLHATSPSCGDSGADVSWMALLGRQFGCLDNNLTSTKVTSSPVDKYKYGKLCLRKENAQMKKISLLHESVSKIGVGAPLRRTKRVESPWSWTPGGRLRTRRLIHMSHMANPPS